MASPRDGQGSQSTLPISPSVIVGIVILCAFCITVLIASVFGYCRNNRSTTTDLETEESLDVFNPNRPLTAGQAARMKEVRWVNNMYAWERARQARKEVGGVRSTALFVGRVGEERHWDEWSSIGSSGGKTFKNSADDYTSVPLFYGNDDSYALSSQHRSSRLMPSSARGSYMSGSQYSGLPQYPSMLLPQPIQRDMIQNPFRRRYPPREIEPLDQQAMQNEGTNPRITINNGVEDLTRCSSITYDNNLEGFAMNNIADERLSPTLVTTTEENDVDMHGTFSALPLRPHTSTTPNIHNENDQVVYQQELRPVQPTEAREDDVERRPSQEGVKAMIEEWEKTNGRYGRHS
ncbi:hypothetical protein RBB50_006329 [Rhinocladiella similis]